MSERRARAPWLIALALGGAYLLAKPTSADLAAQVYRSDLFSRQGFVLWDNAWFAGHHLLAYSLLGPALGAWLGVRVLGVTAVVAAAWAWSALARRHFPGAWLGSAWFALGAGVTLLSGRTTFLLGVALGLGALAALERPAAALALSLLTGLASPVAAAFLALGGIACALSSPHARRLGGGMALAAAAPVLLAAIVFPEGGREPFAASSFWPALVLVLALRAVLPREQRVLRTGAVLYALALLAAFALPTPVGGNAVRLGALVAGPLAAGALGGRRRLALGALAPALLYWQLIAPLRDLSTAAGDPSVGAGYYAPLLARMSALPGPLRLEVPPTREHWESTYLAEHVALARGWERQLDTRFGALFYGRGPTPASYHAWLTDNAVGYVALPDATLDGPGRAEARLIRGGLGYLRELWHSTHWRLYAVRGARPLADAGAAITELATQRFALSAPAPGRYVVALHFSPYWSLSAGHGCVSRAGGNWTALVLASAGIARVEISFALGRIGADGPRCR